MTQHIEPVTYLERFAAGRRRWARKVNVLLATCLLTVACGEDPGTQTAPDGGSPTDCVAGTVQVVAGTDTIPPLCAVCRPGEYCPGGSAASVSCNVGTASWDDDADPRTPCRAQTDCVAGAYIVAEGTATADRVCAPCDPATYSASSNAASCTAWSVCGANEVSSLEGSATMDRTCRPSAVWTRSFGAPGSEVQAVALDHLGNTFAAGHVTGPLPGQTHGGNRDAFVREYDADGTLLWTHQFGSAGYEVASAVGVDSRDGAVVVGGVTSTPLPGQSSMGGLDCFVRKYDAAGTLLWTRQFGTAASDEVHAVTVDATGNVVVVGYVTGTLPGEASVGGWDAFVRKYSADGALLWTRQFGTAASDQARSVTVDTAGDVVVVGYVAGTLSGEASVGGWDAFVRKYSAAGALLWTRQFGSIAGDAAYSVGVDAVGDVVVAGYTDGTLPGAASAGGRDAFVRKYDREGALLWTRQLGTDLSDSGYSVGLDRLTGDAFVAGRTSGTLPGEASVGAGDAFVLHYDASGVLQWTQQLGSGGEDNALALSAGAGRVVIGGYAGDALPTAPAPGNAFVIDVRVP